MADRKINLFALQDQELVIRTLSGLAGVTDAEEVEVIRDGLRLLADVPGEEITLPDFVNAGLTPGSKARQRLEKVGRTIKAIYVEVPDNLAVLMTMAPFDLLAKLSTNPSLLGDLTRAERQQVLGRLAR